MKIRSILAGTALAALALAGGAAAPAGLSIVPQAQAASVSVSFSVFYDELGSYGDWVRYHDDYVFIPTDVDADWRPYTRGHWIHTKRYGWTWASDEPFGWATYHYGRWGYAEDIGWYWVPGTRWAPAWVSWRRNKDYIVWAPLPPSRHDRGADVQISVNVGDIPDFYWVAVPSRRFLAPDIHGVVVHEDREIRRVVERTEFVGAPRITNNIVVNNVIDVNVVAKATGEKVKTVDVRQTNDPREAKATGDQVTVFNGEIAADQQAKPKEVHEASDVKKLKRKGGTGDAAGTQPSTTEKPADQTGQTATQPATGEQPAQTTAEEPTSKDKGKKQPSAQTDTTVQTPAQSAEDQGTVKKPKEKPAAQSDTTVQTPAQSADEQGTVTKGKKKKPAAQSDTADQAPVEDGQGTAADGTKKPKRGKAATQETVQPSDTTGSTTEPKKPADQNAAEDNGQAKGKPAKEKPSRKGKTQECDPQTEDCKPQQ